MPKIILKQYPHIQATPGFDSEHITKARDNRTQIMAREGGLDPEREDTPIWRVIIPGDKSEYEYYIYKTDADVVRKTTVII